MVALSRCLSSVLMLAGVEGARVSRSKSKRHDANTKFIAGVPILNYHAAYKGIERIPASRSGS